MHKEEASKLFFVLGKPNTVKMAKMLYNKGAMSKEALAALIKTSDIEFAADLKSMVEANLILVNGAEVEINRELIDTLMKFIVTPCGCMKTN